MARCPLWEEACCLSDRGLELATMVCALVNLQDLSRRERAEELDWERRQQERRRSSRLKRSFAKMTEE